MRDSVYFTFKRRHHPRIKELNLSRTCSLRTLSRRSPSVVIVDYSVLEEKELFSVDDYPENVFILFGDGQKPDQLKKAVKEHGCHDFFTEAALKSDITRIIKRAKKFLKLKQENLSLKRKLRKAESNETDSGCYNWRFFSQKIPGEIRKSFRQKYSLSFIIADIDYFRQINQSYGYECADKVLFEFTHLVKKILPAGSFLIRGREDSFVSVIPGISRKQTRALAEKIQKRINKHIFKYKKVRIHLSLSFGIVNLPYNGIKNSRDVISAMESALIFSKRKGGNAITEYSLMDKEKIAEKETQADIHSLKRKINRLNREVNQNMVDMIYGFAKAVEVRDMSTANHAEGVAVIAKQIAKKLKLPPHQIEDVYYAAMLHDLGKIGVSPDILAKKGKLNRQDWEVIKTHPWIATEILREIHILRGALPAILYHHEHWDGSGYPLGLKGEEIPVIARIVAVSDVYEALTSDRPYRKAFPKAQALRIMRQERGKCFDPHILDLFLKLITKSKE